MTGLPLESQPKIGADDGGVDLQLFQELGAKSILGLASRKWWMVGEYWLGWVLFALMSYEMNSWMLYQMLVLEICWWCGSWKTTPKWKFLYLYIDFEPVQPLATLKILGCFRLCLLILAPHKMFLRWSFCEFAEAHSRGTSGRKFWKLLGASKGGTVQVHGTSSQGQKRSDR